MILRTLGEWEAIPYGEGDERIPHAFADELASVAKRSMFGGSEGGVLEHGRHSLRARGVVGVLATPTGQLEILPKVDGAERNAQDTDRLRLQLVRMLREVHDLPIDVGSAAQLRHQHETVLEVLVRQFCRQLSDLVRRGMPRRYLGRHDDLPTLRGRLDVGRQFTHLAGSPQRLACQFDELSEDVAFNQVMRATLDRLRRWTRAPDNQRVLSELAFAYAHVSLLPVHALRWDQIQLDRSNQRWQSVLRFARLFLSDRHQDASGGRQSGFALLFEMNVLFERYVARLLAQSVAGTTSKVVAQGGGAYCLLGEERKLFATKPDLRIEHRNETLLIVDTKWKRLTRQENDPQQGVQQGDIYQMMAYQQLYHCPHVVLLYPHHHGLGRSEIWATYNIANTGGTKLSVATLDLTQSRQAQLNALRGLAALTSEALV